MSASLYFVVLLWKDTQIVELEALDYSRLEDAEAYVCKLVTPFVLESAYPGAADQQVPWWWREDRRNLREREERIVEHREQYTLQTIDHGQVVSYTGERPIETAKQGITRIGTHAKYGFGELRIRPVESEHGRDAIGS